MCNQNCTNKKSLELLHRNRVRDYKRGNKKLHKRRGNGGNASSIFKEQRATSQFYYPHTKGVLLLEEKKTAWNFYTRSASISFSVLECDTPTLLFLQVSRCRCRFSSTDFGCTERASQPCFDVGAPACASYVGNVFLCVRVTASIYWYEFAFATDNVPQMCRASGYSKFSTWVQFTSAYKSFNACEQFNTF